MQQTWFLRPRRNGAYRSEEHTSELQSQSNLVCRLLLEKKKTKSDNTVTPCNASSTRPTGADQAHPTHMAVQPIPLLDPSIMYLTVHPRPSSPHSNRPVT